MKNKYSAITVSLVIASLLLSAAAAFGEGIKARMKARLPAIVKLKENGIVGENKMGYLEFVGQKREKEDLIAAENADRMKVYTHIAKKQGTDVQLVGERRALQIAKKAQPGTWLQDQSGKWYQK
jgi:uncharacterized protein YdbL (DUF1318 family)